MPERNRFRHQNYPTHPVLSPIFRKLTCSEGSDGQYARLHTDLGISRVLLIHGTFLGNDPFGIAEILREMGRSIPALSSRIDAIADSLLERTKAISESLPTEAGNYSEDFRELFQRLVGDDPVIEFLEPTWSSQNHHRARADLAVRLAEQLMLMNLNIDERVLFWGHSHAGNAFALLTNLLANDRPSVTRFFDAAGPEQEPHWRAVQTWLSESATPHPIAKQILFAAFGTPVRYGWDPTGCLAILHLLHHREYETDHPIQTKPLYPPHSLHDTLNARYGDWVQAFAIAGTDVSTPVTVAANEKFEQLLTAGLEDGELSFDLRLIGPPRIQQLCSRWKTGTRCHEDGLNILLEYEPSGYNTLLGNPVENSLLGHGVATSIHWLPSHLNLVTNQLQRFCGRVDE